MSSQHPDVLLEKLRDYARSSSEVPPTPSMVAHFLALFDHQNAQLNALRELAKGRPAAPAAPVSAPASDESVCQEADRLVSLDRQAQYGHPREDMNRTATMWEALLGMAPGSIDPEKVAMCMIAVKLSRLCHRYKRDSIVDIAGYAKCVDLIRQAAPAG